MEPSMSKQVIVRSYGDPDQLRVEPMAEVPSPGPGELRVDVEAAGINYLDVCHRQGTHGATLPLQLGLEGVGRVTEVGEEVDAAGLLAPGARVAWIDVPEHAPAPRRSG